MRWPTLTLCLCLISCSATGRGGALHHPGLRLAELAREADGSGALFTSYRSDGPVRWNQSWPWKLDLSGVAWDKPNTATAITPRHVVMAAHFIRKPGHELVFHDRTGRRHARLVETVVKLRDRGLPSDVAIGLLDQPLPASVRCYPLPEPAADEGASLVGATVLVTEQKRALYFHRVAGIRRNHFRMSFDRELPETRRKALIVGDSGHPSFILSRGELLLVETHTGGGGGSGPFYGSAEIQAKLREVLRELDPAHTFRTVGVDRTTLDDAADGRASTPPSQPVTPGPSPSPATPPAPAVPAPGAPRQPRPRVVRPPGD